ncbi:MAG: type II secretion system F family protein [Elusimicrobia bacterium]|nr:type II secretion system F family protein [Elusimicrobiota bacterium]
MMIYFIFISVFAAAFLFVLGFASGKSEMDISERLEIKKRKEIKKQALSIGKALTGAITAQVAKIKFPFLESYRADIKKKLNQAGNPADLSPDGFITLILISVIGMIVMEILFVKKINIVAFGVAGFLGYFLPTVSLKNMITKRHHSIMRELPNVLDLLTLSMEAGIDFNAAVNKVVAKSEKTPLVEELSLMQQGMRLGQSRRAALKDMADRVLLDSLASVVAAIIQADNLGASLGPVLRVQSEQMRVERFQLAEKLAHQAPVKMLFPLMFFIFPSIVIMLFGPLALKFMSGVFEGVF